MTKTITVLFLFSAIAFAAPAKKPAPAKTTPQKSAPAGEATPSKSTASVLSDSWYTMQAGSTPWGYYHEIIEKKNDRYYYRYEMTKKENGKTYLENIGAVSEADLTPVAFNLTKAGETGTEIINGTYTKTANAGQMNVDISGARLLNIKKPIAKNVILEVFLPVWLLQNSAKFKPGFRTRVSLFTEDTREGDFKVSSAEISVRGRNAEEDCAEFDIEHENQKTLWCVNANGALVFMDVNNHQAMVRRVKSEAEAKAILSGDAAISKPAGSKTGNNAKKSGK